jgi:hypothetical protein
MSVIELGFDLAEFLPELTGRPWRTAPDCEAGSTGV